MNNNYYKNYNKCIYCKKKETRHNVFSIFNKKYIYSKHVFQGGLTASYLFKVKSKKELNFENNLQDKQKILKINEYLI